ncbi:TIGR03756 family integrating conjugative element protein [Citrobacter portucalensis]|uniref:TIGR03756 family integrating conjugative element protein n=1 Tax=Citrobacter portucalensis TaxID=1639133 RepID=UPI00226B35A6|nr:TIGR03756 family integrating conjugative element protein [Citrobacter portucalensis]MCX9039238.1 TIGR03756 family integrating conjugative element protein [Citrobacter portucalensis]MCX9062727.1 TIGR03756 family integrating conjugative element protein [Citrobacter portucalensis]
MPERITLLLPLLLCTVFPLRAITTPEIALSALAPNCVQYRVAGLCYWLYCTPFGCSVRTSVKVSHFRPDLVVSAYSITGQNPWVEMALLSPPLPGIAEGGGDTHPRAANQHSKIRFKNADAIGFPAGDELAKFFTQFGYVCSPSSRPFEPYFLSQLDMLAWRSGVPEMTYPEALTPGLREVAKGGDMWGNIYPRAGAISQTHDYKAAAVIAQRVADLVTRSHQPHIYTPLVASPHAGYWPPPPVIEGNSGNHQWQILTPTKSAACSVFPDGSATATYADKQAEDGAYAWTLWRPYKCCPRRGQTFLGSTG